MGAPIAIVVVSWNTSELLDACLRSMREDAQRGLAEVWVVDNGSADGSQDLVRREHDWAHLVEPDRNLGYGPAVNLAAARTASRWLVPSNADIELEPGSLQRLLDVGEADERAGVIGPRLILPDGSTQPGVQPFPGVVDSLLRNLSLYKVSRRIGERLCLAGYWDPDRPAAVDWVTGAFFLVRREAWDAIAGFDDAQWMYAEDLDLCWRAQRTGWRVRYEPSARVHHVLSPAAAKAFGDAESRALRMFTADYAWLRRRRGAWTAWSVAAVSIGTLGLRAAMLSTLAHVAPRRFGAGSRAARSTLRRHVTAANTLRVGSRRARRARVLRG